MSVVNLTETIRSSVEFARPIADEAGVNLRFSGPRHRVDVAANGSALQQLVMNIIGNAVRHTGTGGHVKVAVRAKFGSAKPMAVVEFSDTGSGIAAALLDEIFVAGFSGSGTTSGLGLAVCKQIAQQHDGRLTVESKPGAGTTFLLEIPTI
jgi:two-component system sensor histidine kinase FlrB